MKWSTKKDRYRVQLEIIRMKEKREKERDAENKSKINLEKV
jgi:hypothetical protein